MIKTHRSSIDDLIVSAGTRALLAQTEYWCTVSLSGNEDTTSRVKTHLDALDPRQRAFWFIRILVRVRRVASRAGSFNELDELFGNVLTTHITPHLYASVNHSTCQIDVWFRVRATIGNWYAHLATARTSPRLFSRVYRALERLKIPVVCEMGRIDCIKLMEYPFENCAKPIAQLRSGWAERVYGGVK